MLLQYALKAAIFVSYMVVSLSYCYHWEQTVVVQKAMHYRGIVVGRVGGIWCVGPKWDAVKHTASLFQAVRPPMCIY